MARGRVPVACSQGYYLHRLFKILARDRARASSCALTRGTEPALLHAALTRGTEPALLHAALLHAALRAGQSPRFYMRASTCRADARGRARTSTCGAPYSSATYLSISGVNGLTEVMVAFLPSGRVTIRETRSPFATYSVFIEIIFFTSCTYYTISMPMKKENTLSQLTVLHFVSAFVVCIVMAISFIEYFRKFSPIRDYNPIA